MALRCYLAFSLKTNVEFSSKSQRGFPAVRKGRWQCQWHGQANIGNSGRAQSRSIVSRRRQVLHQMNLSQRCWQITRSRFFSLFINPSSSSRSARIWSLCHCDGDAFYRLSARANGFQLPIFVQLHRLHLILCITLKTNRNITIEISASIWFSTDSQNFGWKSCVSYIYIFVAKIRGNFLANLWK